MIDWIWFASRSRIFHLYQDFTNYKWSGRNFYHCSGLKAMCSNSRHQFSRSHQKEPWVFFNFLLPSTSPKNSYLPQVLVRPDSDCIICMTANQVESTNTQISDKKILPFLVRQAVSAMTSQLQGTTFALFSLMYMYKTTLVMMYWIFINIIILLFTIVLLIIICLMKKKFFFF